MIFIYNLLFIFALGITFGAKLQRKKYKKLYLSLCFFQMFLIQSLRASYVGSDTIQYIDIFNLFSDNSVYAYMLTHYEPGVQALIKVLYSAGLNAQFLLASMSAIIMIGFALYIYHNSDNILISTFLFASMFYPNSFNVSRQYIAMSIALNFFYFLNKREYVKGILLVLFASLFHTSALLFLIPICVTMINGVNITKKALIFFSIFVVLFGNFFSYKILENIHNSYYISPKYVKDNLFSLTTFLTFIYATIFCYYSSICNNLKNKSILNLYACISLVNFYFGVLYLSNEIFSRFIEMLNTHLIISVPFIESRINNKYIPIIKLFFWLVPVIWMLLMIYNSNAGISTYGLFLFE